MVYTTSREILSVAVILPLVHSLAEAWAPRADNIRLPRFRKQLTPPSSRTLHHYDAVSRIEALMIRKRQRVSSRGCRQSHVAIHDVESTSNTDSSRMGVPESKSISSRDSGDVGSRKGGRNLSSDMLQSVDFTTTLLLARELQQTIVPARVETAYQLGPHDLAISLRTLEGNLWLRISWHPKGARCHVGAPPPREKEQRAYTFSQTLRALLRGLNIVTVKLARPFERVISLDFAPRLDAPPSYRLYVEIMASRSNAILVAVEAGGRETVAVCAYQVSPTKSVRPLSTGQRYELPPAMTARVPSLQETLEEFTERVGRVPTQQLKKALVSVYQGMSPMLVGMMASHVPGLTPLTKVGDIALEQWEMLYSGPWRRWLEVVGDGSASVSTVVEAGADRCDATSPWIAEDGNSYYPMTLAEDWCSGSEDGRVSATSLQAVVEKYYGTSQTNREFDALKRRCVARITATLTKLRERVKDYEGQLAAAQEEKVSELNRRGDMLMTYGNTWQQGDSCIECQDFETGERVSIEIKPDKTPVETAQEAYKLGKKLKRGAAVVRDLLDQAKTQMLYAEGIEMALEQLVPLALPHYEIGGEEQSRFTASTSVASPSREELSVLRGIAEELGLLGGADAQRKFTAAFGVKQVQSGLADALSGGGAVSNKRGGKKGKHGKRAGVGGGRKGGKTAESQTADLLQLRRQAGSPVVLVGRNNLQNDRITFSVGKAHELWFHARGVAGAHVLLRLEPGQEVEEDDLAFAADVAVYFSKERQSTSAAVDYISPKAVKKLGSGGPGLVKYDGAKVVRGVPSRVEAVVAEAMRSREEMAR